MLANDSFVCDDCDKERQLPVFPEKMVTTPATMLHAMLRIKDDKPVEIPDDDQLERVEQRLKGVKSNVEERLDNLEKHLTNHTTALENFLTGQLQSGSEEKIRDTLEEHYERVQQRIETLEGRFTSLEKVLQDFLNRVTVAAI
ncbi:hypothetical protein C0991_005074 [Blastosporella zonata]|nr:hypothetical protein C0991_005074 [Blastosporella zonata]